MNNAVTNRDVFVKHTFPFASRCSKIGMSRFADLALSVLEKVEQLLQVSNKMLPHATCAFLSTSNQKRTHSLLMHC